MIFFKDKQARDKAKAAVIKLRKTLNLPKNYEFHHINDSKEIQLAFYAAISTMDFFYKAYTIKKTSDKKFCSESSMAKYITEDLANVGRASVIMDENPKLYSKLCKAKKIYRIKGLTFKESNSYKNELLQIVDYIASYEMNKKRGKRLKSGRIFKLIDKKKKATKYSVK